MYEGYWQLEKKPFKNTPDPDFFYFSQKHEEALSRLLYAVRERKGGALLTGEPGCGKTLLSSALLKELNHEHYRSAIILNPRLSPSDFLEEIIHQLSGDRADSHRSRLVRAIHDIFPFKFSSVHRSQGISHQRDSTNSVRIKLLHTMNDILRCNNAHGFDTIIVIDEAQTINHEHCFEELRLLLNFQSNHDFLVTLVLLGQPELKSRINDMPQLKQRLAVRYHIRSLTEQETKEYIQHRLRIAGAQNPIFSDEAYTEIYRVSSGVPRRINNICDMSLMVGAAQESGKISRNIITVVAEDLEEVPV